MIITPKSKAESVVMAQWACDILDETLEMFGFDRYGNPLFESLGFAGSDGELQCVVIAYHYTKPNVSMAFAAKTPRWASRSHVAQLGKWAFEDLDCNRITAFVRKNNKRARRFDEGVGFKYEGNLRKATDSGDIIVYGLLKEDHQKWLRKAFNGQQRIDKSRSARPV